MQAQVLKIHSDFYYVQNFECKIRHNLKKKKLQICVGDFVEIEPQNDHQAVIVDVLPRKNFISRPSVANVDCALVVVSIAKLDFTQLDRYICHAKHHNLELILVFNKCDMPFESTLMADIVSIYENLCMQIHFISAKEKTNTQQLYCALKGKTCVLLGESGVGKSTLMNAFNPNLSLKTKEISLKTGRGTHSTRHCEILTFNEIKIVDAPGFSRLKFDFVPSNQLFCLFEEFKNFDGGCKFKNCLHQGESGCNAPKIAPSRFKSYLEFLKETKEYKKIKAQEAFKQVADKIMVKISVKKRAKSRKTLKQEIEID